MPSSIQVVADGMVCSSSKMTKTEAVQDFRREEVDRIVVVRTNKARGLVYVWREWVRSDDIGASPDWLDLGLAYTLGAKIPVDRLDDERFKIRHTGDVLIRL